MSRKLKKNRQILLFFLTPAVFIILYGVFFYTPPLLDTGTHDFIEQTIDFVAFSWHMGKASIQRAFLKRNNTEQVFALAAWHRPRFLPKILHVDSFNLFDVAGAFLKHSKNRLAVKIYGRLVEEGKLNLDQLLETEAFFFDAEDWISLRANSEHILKLQPEDFFSQYYLGLSQMNLNELDEAEKTFQNLLAEKPDFADVSYRLGLIYLKKKQVEEARQMLEQAIQIMPLHFDAHDRSK